MAISEVLLKADHAALLADWAATGEIVTARTRLTVTRSATGSVKEDWASQTTFGGHVQAMPLSDLGMGGNQVREQGDEASMRYYWSADADEDVRPNDRVATSRTTYAVKVVGRQGGHKEVILQEIQVANV